MSDRETGAFHVDAADSRAEPEHVERPLRRLTEALLVAVVSLTINLAGNGRVGLFDRDEPRYAVCTREMRESGDWVHPTYNGQPRYLKPALIYWLMLGGTAIGGDNPFGARLVSALMGTGSCLLVWGMGRRMLGRRAGLLAALMLASAPIFVVESKLATTDATLTFFLVLCQFGLWELNRGPSKRWAAAFWVALALATLTKGPVAAAMIATAGAACWALRGPKACWARLEWRWGVALFALITAPWFIAIGILSHGEFYNVAIGYHVIKRATEPIEQHGHFPGYYVLGSLITFYPWSTLLPAGVVGAWARRKRHPELAFVLGWILGPLLFLECMRTRLIHYYTPSYPACALLAAWLVDALARSDVNPRRWRLGRLAIGLLTGIGIAATVGLMAGVVVLPTSLRWPCLVLAAAIGGGTLYGVERFHAGGVLRGAYGLVATWSFAMLITGAWLLPALEPYRLPQRVARRLESLAEREGASPMLATFQEASIVYELGHPVPIFGKTKVIDELNRRGRVVAALGEKELQILHANPRIKVDVKETVRGFHLTKGRNETLQLAVISRGREDSSLARGQKQSGIK